MDVQTVTLILSMMQLVAMIGAAFYIVGSLRTMVTMLEANLHRHEGEDNDRFRTLDERVRSLETSNLGRS